MARTNIYIQSFMFHLQKKKALDSHTLALVMAWRGWKLENEEEIKIVEEITRDLKSVKAKNITNWWLWQDPHLNVPLEVTIFFCFRVKFWASLRHMGKRHLQCLLHSDLHLIHTISIIHFPPIWILVSARWAEVKSNLATITSGVPGTIMYYEKEECCFFLTYVNPWTFWAPSALWLENTWLSLSIQVCPVFQSYHGSQSLRVLRNTQIFHLSKRAVLEAYMLTPGWAEGLSSMYWNGTWKECPWWSTRRCPRLEDAPTTTTDSPFRSTLSLPPSSVID